MNTPSYPDLDATADSESAAPPLGAAESKFAAGKDHAAQAAQELKEAATLKAQELKDAAYQKSNEAKTAATERATAYRQQVNGKVEDTRTRVETLAKEDPIKALLYAAGIGFLAGYIFRK